MPSWNQVTIAGNLTREVELKYKPSGIAVARLGLAINRKFKDKATNQLKEEVTFVDVDLFGKTAELASKFLAKGRAVLIGGRLRYDSWTDKQTGAKRSKLGVVGENIQFLDGKGAGESTTVRDPQAQAHPPTQAQQYPDDAGDLTIQEESVPF